MGTNKPDAGQGMVTTIQSHRMRWHRRRNDGGRRQDGKIVRIRPMRIDANYTVEELAGSLWSLEAQGKTFTPPMKTAPNYFALAYKNRVYSKNRVGYPLKRVDWEPGGDPEKINAANRGRSKFERIWDEALDIMESEIRRIIGHLTPFGVTIGEDGHRESKIFACRRRHSNLMSSLGGSPARPAPPTPVEGWYWGAKHVGLWFQQGPRHDRSAPNRLQLLERHQGHYGVFGAHLLRRRRLGAHPELQAGSGAPSLEVLGGDRQGSL